VTVVSRHVIDKRISLEIPDDWEIWEPSDDVLFVAAAPDVGRDELQPHLMVNREVVKRGETALDYTVGGVVYLRSNQKGYVEHEIEQFDGNSHEVVAVTYNAPAGDWVFTNKQYCVVIGRRAYLITCKMLPEQAAKWLNECDRIACSLEVVDSK